MKSLKFLVITAILLKASVTNAWNPFDSKLQMYRCKDQASAMVCNSCERLEGKKIEFKVNVEKGTVMWVHFENGQMKATNALENCTVVDAKNWSCEVVPNRSESSWHASRQSMANGQYFSSSETKLAAIPSMKMKGNYFVNFGCGK